VTKANGNLSSAARLLGITRPQLAYRLKRMKEADKAVPESKPAKTGVAV
jgi:transcriptional regulator with GAF, ATPase, and Fis domain